MLPPAESVRTNHLLHSRDTLLYYGFSYQQKYLTKLHFLLTKTSMLFFIMHMWVCVNHLEFTLIRVFVEKW